MNIMGRKRSRKHTGAGMESGRGLDILFHLHYIHGIDEKDCSYKCDFTILVGWEFFQDLSAFQVALNTNDPERKAADLVYQAFSARRTPWNCDSRHSHTSIEELQKSRQGSGEMEMQLQHESKLLQGGSDGLMTMTWSEFTTSYVSACTIFAANIAEMLTLPSICAGSLHKLSRGANPFPRLQRFDHKYP
jgi:hypothetical protein